VLLLLRKLVLVLLRLEHTLLLCTWALQVGKQGRTMQGLPRVQLDMAQASRLHRAAAKSGKAANPKSQMCVCCWQGSIEQGLLRWDVRPSQSILSCCFSPALLALHHHLLRLLCCFPRQALQAMCRLLLLASKPPCGPKCPPFRLALCSCLWGWSLQAAHCCLSPLWCCTSRNALQDAHHCLLPWFCHFPSQVVSAVALPGLVCRLPGLAFPSQVMPAICQVLSAVHYLLLRLLCCPPRQVWQAVRRLILATKPPGCPQRRPFCLSLYRKLRGRALQPVRRLILATKPPGRPQRRPFCSSL